jgi:DNA (cytosine-5)-methyltransferase 1
MKHIGDITKINGTEIEPVDIITFGSPCQDLSIAGKRAGLEGGRSGLFMEAVRIIKEMRNATNRIRPRFAVWENVLGAFSSNEGEDFRTVLQEIAAITEPGVSIPRPSSREGWLPAGTIMGDGWSIAWRVLDAQYWGVPQRRKRIFLVADFRGECAGEILFKPAGLQGNIAESGEEREGITAETERGVGKAIPINTQVATRHNALGERTGLGIGKEGDVAFTLQEGHSHAVAGFNGWRSVTGAIEYEEDRAPCLQANMPPNTVYPKVAGSLIARADGSPCIDRGQPFVCEQYAVDFGRTADRIQMNPEKAVTLQGEGGGCGAKTGLYCLPAYCIQGNTIERSDEAGANGKGVNENVAFTLNTTDRHAVAFDCRNHVALNELSSTLQAKDKGYSLNYINPVATFAMQGLGDYKESDNSSTMKGRDHKDSTDLVSSGYTVRRLTPM